MSGISHIRGDTFSRGIRLWADGGYPALSLWGIRSQLRTLAGELVEELTITKSVDAGTFTVSSAALSTSSWPVGQAKFDIQFTRPDGSIFSTETVSVEILPDVTT